MQASGGSEGGPILRVLLLEDDPDDAEQVVRELRKRGLRLDLRRVDGRDEFIGALSECPPDVILADHALPAFSGIEALRIALARCPGTPFLFVSGHIGEDRAIEALKEGATDYILKDNLTRLGPAVERAVREHGERAGRLEAQESLEQVLQNALDAVVMMGADGRITRWNAEAERMFGWTAGEAVGRPLADVVIPERLREAHRRGLRRFLETGEGPILGRRIEIEGLHRNGHEFVVELSVTPIRTEAGVVFNAFLRDISDRKRAQARLTAEHAVGRVLAEAPSFEQAVSRTLEALCRILGWDVGAYWVPDAQTGLLIPMETHAPDPRPQAFLEASRSTRFAPGVGLLGRVWQERVPLWYEDISREGIRTEAARKDGLRGALAFPVLHDAEVFGLFEFVSRAALKPDPELLEVVRSVGRHIGLTLARLRAENANWLRTERAMRHRAALLQLAKTISDDLARTLARVTETVADLLEVDRASVWRFSADRSELVCEDLFLRSSGTHERGLRLPTKDYPRYVRALEASRVVAADDALRDPRTSEFSDAYLAPLGITSMMDVPIRLHGSLAGVVCHEHVGAARRWTGEEEDFASSAADLVSLALEAAERRRAEEQVHQLNRDLERRVAERTAELDSFAYSVAHDLRAPLRSMRGFSEALLEDHAAQLPPEGQDYAARISKAAARMNALIEDLLSYSRLAREAIAQAPVDLSEIVKRLLEEMAPDLLDRKASVTVDEPLPRVLGHSMTLHQVLHNLLSNAIKFVPPGVEPRVRVRAEPIDGRVRLWVEDNGIGVASEHHDRIFRVFERLHSNEDYPGTGIGLAIVRKAMDRMGGGSGLESELGKGSRFWIELPVA